MEKGEIQNYIEKLQQIENEITSGETQDEFYGELSKLLDTLGNDIQKAMTPTSNVLQVKVKKLKPSAVIPSYAKDGDAGMDLTITEIISQTEKDITYGFGLAFEIPRGYVGLVFPRSSVRKMDLTLSNCVAVIDSGYRGEVQATFKKTNGGVFSTVYNVGERGAQIIILPYPTVKFIESDELSDTERGTGGFGSSGA